MLASSSASKEKTIFFAPVVVSTGTNPPASIFHAGPPERIFKPAISLHFHAAVHMVTSAAHLSRALPHFAPHPAGVLAAPSDYAAVETEPGYSLSNLPLPTARNWLRAERLFHETLGGWYENYFRLPRLERSAAEKTPKESQELQ